MLVEGGRPCSCYPEGPQGSSGCCQCWGCILHPHGLLAERLFWQDGWLFRGEKGLFRLSWILPRPKCGVFLAGKRGGTAGPGDALSRDTALTLILETLQTVPGKAPESRLTAELLAPSPDGLLGSERAASARLSIYITRNAQNRGAQAGKGGIG